MQRMLRRHGPVAGYGEGGLGLEEGVLDALGAKGLADDMRRARERGVDIATPDHGARELPGAEREWITDRVAPGVVYTTFHHPNTQANVVTTDFSDWATNCPEYKVTAVQVAPSNGPSEWQREYHEQAEHSRRIAHKVAAE